MTHAHQLAVALDEQKMQANAIGGLGAFLVWRGDAAGAIEHLKRALPMHRAADDPHGVAATLNSLPVNHMRALQALSSALELGGRPGRIAAHLPCLP